MNQKLFNSLIQIQTNFIYKALSTTGKEQRAVHLKKVKTQTNIYK